MLGDQLLGFPAATADLVAIQRVAARAAALDGSGGTFEELYEAHRRSAAPLLPLLLNGVWFDESDTHADLWVDALQHLLDARIKPDGAFNETMWAAQHYPALLALWTMGAAAVSRNRETVFVRLLTEPTWRSPHNSGDPEPAATTLSYYSVLDGEAIQGLTRWKSTRWQHPASHLVRADLADVLRTLLRTDDQQKEVIDAVEYRVALAGYRLAGRLRMNGEFIGEWRWRNGTLQSEETFRQAAAHSGGPWPWRHLLGEGTEEVEDLLVAFGEELKKHMRW